MYKTCGKFVYEIGKTVGKKCVHSSTVSINIPHWTVTPRGKDTLIHFFTPLLPKLPSTTIQGYSTPVYSYFIPTFHTTYNYLYKELKKGKN